MSKKKVQVLSTEGAVALIPEGADTEHTPLEVKISKAEMADMIIVQIQQALDIELKKVDEEVDANNKLMEEYRTKVGDRLRKRLKSIVGNLVPDRLDAISYSFDEDEPSKWGANIHQFRCDACIEHFSLEKDGVYVYCSGYTASLAEPASEAYLELVNKKKALEAQYKDIMGRHNKSRDARLIKSQINAGILASMKNGKQVIENLSRLSEDMISKYFSTNSTPKLGS